MTRRKHLSGIYAAYALSRIIDRLIWQVGRNCLTLPARNRLLVH